MRRQGRLTPGQRRALERLWPKYVLDEATGLIDLNVVFGRRAFRVLEIGFGNGESLAKMATLNRNEDFLGIEVHLPGIGHLLSLLEERDLTNVRVICDDAIQVLRSRIQPQSFDRVQLFFPDPWPKKRHHKRRIVQQRWVNLLVEKLKPGGSLHITTDWEDYAAQALQVLTDNPSLVNTARSGHYTVRPSWRPETKFERRGLALGHRIRDLAFRRRLSSDRS